MRTSVQAQNTGRKDRARTKRKRVRAERGIALVLAMTTVAVLFMLAQQVRENTVTYVTAAQSGRDEVIAYYEARSIVNLSRLVLHSEPTIRKALLPTLGPLFAMMGRGFNVPQLPIWENIDILLGPFRKGGDNTLAESAGLNLSEAKGIRGLVGANVPVIVDEDSMINLNGFERGPHIVRRVGQQLVGLTGRPALEPYFSEVDPDGQHTDRVTLIAALIDWADADTNLFDAQSLLGASANGGGGNTGAEDSIYQNFKPPYQRKNAPFDSTEELRLVRGLGDDDLWQAMVEPDASDPKSRTLTVWGQGAVNINTANAQTQLAIACAYAPPTTPACSDPTVSATFIEKITLVQMFSLSMGVPLYTDAKVFTAAMRGQPPLGPLFASLQVPVIPIVGNQIDDAVTTESKVFSIYAESSIRQAHVRVHAVVDMRPQPAIPSSFLRGGQLAAPTVSTNQAVGAGRNGNVLVASAGGTVIYWRED